MKERALKLADRLNEIGRDKDMGRPPIKDTEREAATLIRELQSRLEELEKESTTLKKDAERYRWLRDQKRLHLESESMTWTRKDGSKYTSTHYLSANGTSYAPLESIDLTIDTAMQSNEGN